MRRRWNNTQGPQPWLRAIGEDEQGVIYWRTVWKGEFPAHVRSGEAVRRRRQILSGRLKAGVGVLGTNLKGTTVFIEDYLAAVREAHAEENPKVIVLGRAA